MESAFAWLQDTWRTLVRFVPHLKIVRATHAGVKFVRGSEVVEVKPGLCWWWPVVTELELVPVAQQIDKLPQQTLETSDGRTVIARGVVAYRVTDVVKFLTAVWDAPTNIEDVAAAALREVVTDRTLEQLKSTGRRVIENAIRREVAEKVEMYGVEVDWARLTDFACSRVLNIVLSHTAEAATHTLVDEPA